MNEPRAEFAGPEAGGTKHLHKLAAPAAARALYPLEYKNFHPSGSYAVSKPFHDGNKRQMLAQEPRGHGHTHAHAHAHGPRGYSHHGPRGHHVDVAAAPGALNSPSLPGLSMLLREQPHRVDDFLLSPRSPAGDFPPSPRSGRAVEAARLAGDKCAAANVAASSGLGSYQQFLSGSSSTPSTTSGSSEDDPDVAPRAASGARHQNAPLTRQQQHALTQQASQQLLQHQHAQLQQRLQYHDALTAKPPRASVAPAAAAAATATAPTAAPAATVAASAGLEPPAAPATKASRYLREMDRRAILSRIERGEKQSALAKEYQVSRAAICNLNKHRDEVLSRQDGNPLAKHPKKPRPKAAAAAKLLAKGGWASAMALGAGTGKAGVHEIKSRAAALLLTTLRKKHTAMSEFRRSSERLMRLVMEEALAHVPVKTVEIFLTNQVKSDGVALEHPPCAISMEPAGCPMLELFHRMEPEQPTGYVSFGGAGDVANVAPSAAGPQPQLDVTLCDERLPASLNYHNVFLVDHVVSSGELVCAVVRRLQERGAVEAMISLVVLLATSEAVAKVHAAFPGVKIVTAQVDAGSDEAGDEPDKAMEGAQPASRARASTTDMILDRLEQVYHGYSPAEPY